MLKKALFISALLFSTSSLLHAKDSVEDMLSEIKKDVRDVKDMFKRFEEEREKRKERKKRKREMRGKFGKGWHRKHRSSSGHPDSDAPEDSAGYRTPSAPTDVTTE